jgi:hypothetical protein
MQYSFGIPLEDKIITKPTRLRKKKNSVEDYINIRIEQLKADRDKASDPHDKQWYTRLIQELSWVTQRKENCSLESLGVI